MLNFLDEVECEAIENWKNWVGWNLQSSEYLEVWLKDFNCILYVLRAVGPFLLSCF